MAGNLFVFIAQGVATDATPYRPGARHALMLKAVGPDIAAARAAAVSGAEAAGWSLVTVRREKQIGADPSAIGDAVLRSAAEQAIRDGHAMVVYADELDLDS